MVFFWLVKRRLSKSMVICICFLGRPWWTVFKVVGIWESIILNEIANGRT
jgi:hypothetical protein